MIDYEKLKLAHELANKANSQIHYAYQNKDGNHVCWVSLDQLLLEMKELTDTPTLSTQCPKCNNKRVADGICWVLGCHYHVEEIKTCVHVWERKPQANQDDLIACMKCGEGCAGKCEHESDGLGYLDRGKIYARTYTKCKKCGEFYR